MTGKVNLLLVDDQPARLLTYQAVLADLGQNLVLAHSGREALEKLMREEFALVLLDVSMPDMDGFETAQLIHEHPRFEQTPIIFVTGVHVTELDRLKGYKAGAVDYVSIPVVPEILRSKVAVLVELYCKRRELSELNRHLAETNEQLAQANSDLQAEKTRELQALNETLQRINSDLEGANSRLQSEVAERSRAEHALKEADRQKDEFLAMLAHELRNPLAPIRNAIALMHMQPAAEPLLREARDVIDRQLSQLTRLVDDLLDVSRITHGRINLSPEVIRVGDLVARACETAEPLIRERGHTLRTEIGDGTLTVHGDCLRLTQAIGNVLANAAKYTERGGQITLSTCRSDTQLEIRVRDSGIGIEPERLAHIFDLFTQFHAQGDYQAGLGIGLAIVRRLVEMHGGTVRAMSAGAGQGSEFVIGLPLVSADDEPRTPRSEPVAAAPTTRRILVADDNADALESLATLLTLSGHEVYRALDGTLALEAAERYMPDVVLLDIGMPQLSGYDVARQIRARPWGQRLVLVALTGWGQESDRRRSQEAGFNSHLVKPVDPQVLNRLLAELPVAVPVT